MGTLGDVNRLETAEREICAVHAAWIQAVNAGDLAQLLALMTEDVVFLGPGQAPFGREGFSAHFLAAIQQMQFVCCSELEEVVVVGAFAHTRCRDSLTITPRSGGTEEAIAGHRLTLYRQQPDGRWLLARDAHTLLPRPAPNPAPGHVKD